LLLASPLLDLQLGFADNGSNPTSYHTRRAYDLLKEGFGPGFNGPLVLAVEQAAGLDQRALDQLTGALRSADGVAAVSPPQANQTGDTAVITVIPTTSPQDDRTSQLIHRLRDDVIAPAVAGSEMRVYVGGPTATFVDLGEQTAARTPLFFAVVVGLSFLLLAVVFRSVVIALKAALMNLLSIGAAYGVVIAVFQWGWAASLFGVEQTAPIAPFLPMFLFSILFGLSMDYEVFLLSRIREAWVGHGNTREAVAQGLSVTARVITAAAAIMVLVFLSFVFTDNSITKQFGLGLAAAILVDATVVRLILVPATMELLGEWNWWFPTWLDRLVPRLNVEGTVPEVVPAPVVAGRAGD
jgi:RND superfamily putative drug exporter